jgi:sugar lactone lactonase YvrE
VALSFEMAWAKQSQETQMNGHIETLLDGLSVPEGPRWHDGRLWFSDIYSDRVYATDLSGNAEVIAEVAGHPSGLGWTAGNKLLVVSVLERRVLRMEGGLLQPFADLSVHTTSPCNDLVSDGSGRVWVGEMGFDWLAGAEHRPGRIWYVAPNGVCVLAADGLAFPNGMVITLDGKRLIAAETFGNRLTSFDIAADNCLINRREFAACDGAYPDGMCLDTEGAIWVADPSSNRAMRIVDGGHVAQTVTVAEGRYVFACALGGEDERTLFLCTSSVRDAASREAKQGRIEIVHVDVPGVGLP